MHRRNMLRAAVSAFGAAFAASRASAAAEAPPPGKLKVVYHLTDLEKVNFVIGNIQNHLDGVGGPENVTISLVIHGQALRAFHSASVCQSGSHPAGRAVLQGRPQTRRLRQHHESQNVSLKDLLPGFVSAEKGGVVRLAELQSQGYLYLRP